LRPLERAVRAAFPSLLFGFGLCAFVSLALYAAFRLQLDNPFWAGASAAIMCRPQLGASLRKGWFRILGTFVGAVVSESPVKNSTPDRAIIKYLRQGRRAHHLPKVSFGSRWPIWFYGVVYCCRRARKAIAR
jgi:hypothetical protein